ETPSSPDLRSTGVRAREDARPTRSVEREFHTYNAAPMAVPSSEAAHWVYVRLNGVSRRMRALQTPLRAQPPAVTRFSTGTRWCKRLRHRSTISSKCTWHEQARSLS